MNSSYVKCILFSDIKSFTKKTPFSQHILFIHILPSFFIKGFNHMGWLKTCWISTNSPFSCFNSDKLKKKHFPKHFLVHIYSIIIYYFLPIFAYHLINVVSVVNGWTCQGIYEAMNFKGFVKGLNMRPF